MNGGLTIEQAAAILTLSTRRVSRPDPRLAAVSKDSDSVRATGTATLSPSIPRRRGRRSTLDSKAQQRGYVLTHVLTGELSVAQAAAVLRLSTRQVDRLTRRFRDEGAAALVHGNRGRAPTNRTAEAIRVRLVELATTEFAGFKPVHVAETLAEEGDAELAVSPRTIRRLLARRDTRRRGPPQLASPEPARAHAASGHAPPGRREPPRLARGAGTHAHPHRGDRRRDRDRQRGHLPAAEDGAGSTGRGERRIARRTPHCAWEQVGAAGSLFESNGRS